MPQYIATMQTTEPPFMCWTPGTTEKHERAERIAQSIAENCAPEEVQPVETQPFTYHD
jgi:hypothetical protein